ncbi:MAG: glycosyltransferase [Candidatus Xenobia bacterium]
MPENVHLLVYADHDALMDRASMVVTHGGHGTTMRALSKGLPMAIIPAKAGDQAPISHMVQDWGAGIALPTDAAVDAIRTAVSQVLSGDRYREEARRRAPALTGPDGADLAAAFEALASSVRVRTR